MFGLMVDLETLSNGPQAAITQIGVAYFHHTPNNVLWKRKWNVDVQSCIDLGLKVDGHTLAWWFKQSDEARHSVLGDEHVYLPLQKALDEFDNLYINHNIERTWAGPTWFDVAILFNAYRQSGRPYPWPRRSIRDTKTLFDLAQYDPRESSAQPILAHDAGDDAEAQAWHVLEAMAKLGV